MKITRSSLCLILILFLYGCGGTPSESPKGHNYLDSTFYFKTRIAALESLRVSKTVDEPGFQALKKYTSRYRSLIGENKTYGEILSAANTAAKIDSSIRIAATTASQRTDMKVVEFYFKVGVWNHSDLVVESIRGYLEFLSENGEAVGQTPTFSIEGPVKPGDSLVGLQLQYAHDKPTGNELSDPKLSQFREDLDQWVSIAKTNDPERFRFVRLDLELEGGITPAEYALGKKGREENDRSVKLGLLKWASKNESIMENLKKPLSGFSVVVTPVLTKKWEATHGKWLIFDRIAKVEKFFVANQKVPAEHFNPPSPEGVLMRNEIIDFWGWPMEIRIYKGESW